MTKEYIQVLIETKTNLLKAVKNKNDKRQLNVELVFLKIDLKGK